MRINPRLLLGGLVVVILAFALYIGVRGGADSAADTKRSQDQSSDQTSRQVISEESKADLQRRVKAFATDYFSLDPNVTPQEARKGVEKYVSSDFLRDAQFGFGDSEADNAMKREGASIVVTEVSDYVGPIEGFLAFGEVTLTVEKRDRDGTIVWSMQRQQPMTWQYYQGTWMVLDAPRA